MIATSFLAVLDAGDVLAAVRHFEDTYTRADLAALGLDDRRRVARAVHLAAYRAGQLDRYVQHALQEPQPCTAPTSDANPPTASSSPS